MKSPMLMVGSIGEITLGLELSLFAWRRCCQDGEEEALRLHVDLAFAWVHEVRENFPFQAYAVSQGAAVIESIPTQWRP